MTNNNILHINSSGRYKDSLTRNTSTQVINKLMQTLPNRELVIRDLASGLPFVNEPWINANFTEKGQRTSEQHQALEFSDKLIAELQSSEYIVIASPIYNFNVPAVLKAWIDMIARVGVTFRYTKSGPIGLLQNKKVYIVMASGGVPIESEMDLTSKYLKQVLAFIGVSDVRVIDVSKVTGDNGQIDEQKLARLVD